MLLSKIKMKGERKSKVASRNRAPASSGKGSQKGIPSSNSKGSTDSAFFGNLNEVKDLIDLVIKKGITELEIERAGTRVRIARHAIAKAPEVSVIGPSGAAAEAHPVVPAPAAQTVKAGEEVHIVRSPMVGTFYVAPSQGAPAFVSVGDRIQSGQVLCIIEAMKLMNEIEAEAAGEIVCCHVENGQPVEYGQPLFDIRPLSAGKK